ncbi:hypothetical protein KJA15_03555 [Patescibacteria group bacterium]|nr:hypothetical protein [Patescibacteria group bacterium]
MCETEFCRLRLREHFRILFKNMFGKEPNEKELECFMKEHLRRVKK